ncbi:aminotransferase class I/II-fold pyridoxal phosphate-dependent enzyme [Chachezhania antarctica]|uniref:aminotransferase class I/II-fold pyridoxal phosphate-dependent enzyme n=1 Tax=Chachezhania antarctica TaxID=2340860 RepID=UPI000EB4CC50|nr:aminotransferase class I/II-fold pyridoxal phosphate-dependent enzyme [Chachezhania antarctica]|tara:strand:+ start:2748 stop:3929 length:1182 start_codon:yes stop_codon:yes gene_type:complete
MDFPERFSNLPVYAFPRLRELLDAHAPGGDVIHMTIGEPKHAFPSWVTDVIVEHAAGFNSYPPNDGSDELRAAYAGWIARRYGMAVDPATQVLPLNGSREGLYNVAMALLPEHKNGQRPVIVAPNPFYQVYMVAAISIGAEPVFAPATASTGYLPDYAALGPEILNRTVALYICSPANPQGAVATAEYWSDLLDLAEQYDFRIFADECYSEIYRDQAPTGILEVCDARGTDPDRVVAFHSLSKRSNLPGLRAGFAVSGPGNIARMKQLRAYSGAPPPAPLQAAAARAWADEVHVEENRALYREKYLAADDVLGSVQGYKGPEAGFFLWLPVDDGEAAALKLWTETGVRVLPGAYLAQGEGSANPGTGYVRVAMVAEKTEMVRGLTALRDCLYT